MSLLAPFSGCTPSTAPPQQPPNTTITESATPKPAEQKPVITVVAPERRQTPTGKEVLLKYYSDRMNVGKLARAAQKGREAGLPSDWDTFEAAIDIWNELSLDEVVQLLAKASEKSD